MTGICGLPGSTPSGFESLVKRKELDLTPPQLCPPLPDIGHATQTTC